MRRVLCIGAIGIVGVAGVAQGQDGPGDRALMPEYESVYAPPQPRRPGEGVNEGGVQLDITVEYMTDYVWRGFDRGEFIAAHGDSSDGALLPPGPIDSMVGEDAPAIQIDETLTWDLGRAPHPFVGVFLNTLDADPESSFQEIRPYLGVELTLRPLILSAGHTSYIHPNRDQLDTTEMWGRLELDDSYFYRSQNPIFSPYVMAAYDYDLYDGLYMEAGVQHVIDIADWGVTLTAQASAAYVDSHPLFAIDADIDNTGFQHYQLGLIGEFELNTLLNVPQRYGTWTLRGYLYYTDAIEDDLRSDTQLWGGAGIGFSY